MKAIEIAGVRVEVDEERTALLQEMNSDWCQCDGCNNARMTRNSRTSEEQKGILSDLGVDFRDPYASAYGSGGSKESPHHSRRNTCWIAYGLVVDAVSTPTHRFDRYNWIWVESRREAAQRAVEVYPVFDRLAAEKGLIYILTSNSVPWLPGEVCGFRQDYAKEPCPVCGSRWRETGYLKRRSLIPEWQELHELKRVLRDRKRRVYTEFCSSCGRMDYRIVEDRRPFRVKNTLYEDERKLQHALAIGKYPHLFGSKGPVVPIERDE